MKHFTHSGMQRFHTRQGLSLTVLGVLLAVLWGGDARARSNTFGPLGFRNTACSGWEHVRNPGTQTITFTGAIDSDGDVIGDFWYEYQNRWTHYELKSGTSYHLTLSNPPAGGYQLCWSHTTTGNRQVTGTLTTTVSDGADLTVTKEALSAFAIPETSLTYEITVMNHGPGEARQMQVVDVLPFGVEVEAVGPRSGDLAELSRNHPNTVFLADGVDVSCHVSDLEGQPVVSCDLGYLGVGEEITLTLSVLVTWEASEWDLSGTLINQVAVKAANAVAPFDDDEDTVETPVGGEPIAGICTVQLCKLSTPLPRTGNSPDVRVTATDANNLALRGVGFDFSFEVWTPKDGFGNYHKTQVGTDSQRTDAVGSATSSPVSATGRPPLWTHVRVSITTVQRFSCTEMVFEPGNILERAGDTATYPDIPEC